MGQRILVMGASGTGKSASLRNFGADEIELIKVIEKKLPFRGKFENVSVSDKVAKILPIIKNSKKKVIVIDDCQYIMGNEFFRRALEKGYDKFSEIGQNFFNLLAVADELPDDVFVYYLTHIETDMNGNEKVKTIGKMLDEKLTIEGYFTIVLKTVCVDGVYSFQTQNNGHDTVKSPMGMFEGYLIDNDLKVVDGVAREYWGYTDEVVEQHVVAAEKPQKRVRGANTQESKEEAPVRRTRAEQIASGETETKVANPTEVETPETPSRVRRTRSTEPAEEPKKDVTEISDAEAVRGKTLDEMIKECDETIKSEELPHRRVRTRVATEETPVETKEEVKEENPTPQRVRRVRGA